MRRIRPVLIVLVVVAVVAAGIWYARMSTSSPTATGISTSGFIEATTVSIAPEIAGRIVSIAAAEGDQVKAAVPLVTLDDSLLKAQQRQAEAVIAQAQVAVEQAQAVVEQGQAAVEQTRMSRDQAITVRDGAKKAWDNARDVQQHPLALEAAVIVAQGQVDIARTNVSLATDGFRKLTYPYTYYTFAFDVPTAAGYIQDAMTRIEGAGKGLRAGLTSDQYITISQQLQQATDDLTKGRDLLARGQGPDVFLNGTLNVNDFWTLRAAQLQMDQAQSALDTATKTLKNAQDVKNNPQQINAAVDSAHSAYDTAVNAVNVAESAVTLTQKQVAVAQKQAAAAQKQVDQAQASLDVIKVQMSKTTLVSPVPGVVGSRNAEVGEIAQPGAPILIVTQLDKVTLTAYVPESQIGLVKLGQKALVSVDSYPGMSFSGDVTFISPQAQFTPGNVQLKAEREKTVFAVKISLPNPDRRLKPGMPADAQILVSP